MAYSHDGSIHERGWLSTILYVAGWLISLLGLFVIGPSIKDDASLPERLLWAALFLGTFALAIYVWTRIKHADRWQEQLERWLKKH
jgi:hypothetical protein